jgi:hypothetical protein
VAPFIRAYRIPPPVLLTVIGTTPMADKIDEAMMLYSAVREELFCITRLFITQPFIPPVILLTEEVEALKDTVPLIVARGLVSGPTI